MKSAADLMFVAFKSHLRAATVPAEAVYLISERGMTAGLTVRGLEGAGDDEVTFSLVLCGGYLDPELNAVNAAHLVSGRPWLLAKPSGAEAWVGPVFRPGSGPCWACLAKRLEDDGPGQFITRRVLGSAGSRGSHAPPLPAAHAAGLHVAVLEAAKWLAGFRHQGQQAVYILDPLTARGAHHPVARRLQCPSCGDPGPVAERAGRPLANAVPDIGGHDGHGQRALSPEEMLEK